MRAREKKCPNNPYPHLLQAQWTLVLLLYKLAGRPGTESLHSTFASPKTSKELTQINPRSHPRQPVKKTKKTKKTIQISYYQRHQWQPLEQPFSLFGQLASLALIHKQYTICESNQNNETRRTDQRKRYL